MKREQAEKKVQSFLFSSYLNLLVAAFPLTLSTEERIALTASEWYYLHE
jgi:hypothetical protein